MLKLLKSVGIIVLFSNFGVVVYGQCQLQALKVNILHQPQKIIIEGKLSLYYELHLVNTSSDTITLKSVKIYDPSDLTTITSLDKSGIKKRLSKQGGVENIVLPKNTAVLYLELEEPGNKDLLRLVHHIEYSTSCGITVFCFDITTPVLKLAPVVVSAPLNGGPWAAVYNPEWERGHRRVIFSINGKERIPGRFAIDFIKLDDKGHYANGNSDSIKNWYGYKTDVLAVSDGVVASVRNDFTESLTLSGHLHYNPDKATGNYISLKLADSIYAFYEHLQPGSIKVKPGSRVKRGDVIASLGFTGQSTGPHLHFHLADTDSPLGAEGIPYLFKRFKSLGIYDDFERFGLKPWNDTKIKHTVRTKERPVSNSVILFY